MGPVLMVRMKRLHMVVMAGALWSGCGGSTSNRCAGVVCDRPWDTCRDENTLLIYESAGACNPIDGSCEYEVREKTCQQGCVDGRCGEDRVCIDDGHELGPPCLERVETEEEMRAILFERVDPTGKVSAATKYLMPVTGGPCHGLPAGCPRPEDPCLIPLVFHNSNRYRLHVCFLCCALPGWFGGCNCDGLPESCTDPACTGPTKYLELIMRRGVRSYYAGVIQRVDDFLQGRLYGFNVWTDLSDPAEQLEMKEVREIYQRMRAVFLPEKLVYFPTDGPAVDKARTWIDPDFPVYLPLDEVKTEVYTSGTAYGRIRRLTLAQLEAAISRGELSWQDIVVVDRVPFDIETVVAAVVTGGRQWELSHVNVRMARRGTPNLYVKDALEKFEELDGALVRLDAVRAPTAGSDDRYTAVAAELADAEGWWSEHRPDIGTAPAIDPGYRGFDHVLEMDADDDPVPLISRFGGKAANLARLYAFLPADHQVAAFGIPFAWFEEFMQANTILDTRVEPPEEVSLRTYVERLVTDERFRTDAAYRRDRLWDLRAAMRNEATVDPALVSSLAERIREVFGAVNLRVRFRSSSNVEDALEFSGAGLYTSTTVCAADSLDGDLDGPSACDLDQDEERTIERGLRRVWASLYNSRAWEEREWYQIPHEEAGMAILVSRAFPDERANGVAFTGNPGSPSDDRYLINAQLGDEPVVGNDPRIVPERDLLTVDEASGEVTRIYRSRSSALAEPGVYVLPDAELEELGALLHAIDRDYPQETGPYSRDKILLDLEFKIDAGGALRIKQIRPFLEKCRHVLCNQPPDDTCQDAATLLRYRTFGSCDSGSGECRYESYVQDCPNGCADGACIG